MTTESFTDKLVDQAVASGYPGEVIDNIIYSVLHAIAPGSLDHDSHREDMIARAALARWQYLSEEDKRQLAKEAIRQSYSTALDMNFSPEDIVTYHTNHCYALDHLDDLVAVIDGWAENFALVEA